MIWRLAICTCLIIGLSPCRESTTQVAILNLKPAKYSFCRCQPYSCPSDSCRPIHADRFVPNRFVPSPIHVKTYSCQFGPIRARTDSCPALFMPIKTDSCPNFFMSVLFMPDRFVPRLFHAKMPHSCQCFFMPIPIHA